MKQRFTTAWRLFWVLVFAWTPTHAQELNFSVQRVRLLRDSAGVLHLDEAGISYDAPSQEEARRWSFEDIRHAEILSAKEIVLHTYGEPGRYEFRLREGELDEIAYSLLAGRVPRGVTSRVLFPATDFLYNLPMKHRHRFGGCEGVLRVNSELLIFDTENPEDRRMWRMRDIRSFGTAGPYTLRLTTDVETFNFDLKTPLTQDIHDFLWQRVYGTSIDTKTTMIDVKRIQPGR